VNENCPICGICSEQGRSGDARQVRCPRCGPYVITLTARAMLGERLEAAPNAYARLSYAIRHQTSEANWLCVSSVNLDDLARARLPTPRVQRLNLLKWMADQVEDDRLASVRPPPFDHLAAVAGAINGERVFELLRHAIREGYVEPTEDGGYRISPKGWEELEGQGDSHRIVEEIEDSATVEASQPEIVQAVCPQCGPRRRAEVLAEYTERQPPDGRSFTRQT
jgi:hypothetical protein